MGPRERGAGFVVEDPLAMIRVSTFHDTEQRERSGSLQLEEGPQTCWREEHCAEPGLNFSLRASSGEGKVGAWGSLSASKKLPVQPNKVPATGMKELK